jgi:hypothetical protein
MRRARGERLMSKEGFKFKELRVWQKGKDLAVYIQKETFKFKEIEKRCVEISSMLSS